MIATYIIGLDTIIPSSTVVHEKFSKRDGIYDFYDGNQNHYHNKGTK